MALLAGRAAGFIREMLLASSLGASAEADFAVLLLTLPDLLVNLLLSGGLSVALIPVFRESETGHSRAVFQHALLVVTLVFSALALWVALWPAMWLGLLAPGGRFDLSAPMRTAILLVALAVPLTAIAGVSTAWLNARDRFFVAGCGTLIFNLCIIVALASAGSYTELRVLELIGWGVFVGALLRFGAQAVALPRTAWRIERGPWRIDGLLLRAFLAAMTASSLMLLVPVIVRALASVAGTGALASFNYATKLVELPVGILITTLATVAFPHLSGLLSQGDRDAANRAVGVSLARCAVLAVAVVLPGWWFADAVVELLFMRGRLDAAATARIVELTRVLVLAVPFIGVAALATAHLNADRRTGTVLRINFACLMALPLLAAPGLWLASPAALMGAVVAFYVLLAAAMSRAAGVVWVGEGGWMNRRMYPACAGGALAGAALIAGATVLGLSDPRLRTAAAVAAFSVITVVGLRLLSNSSVAHDTAGQ
ncbi:lipid II flippase MurJ [Rhizobacter sp. LjRoot28]|uniref:lipid II flippase MurJ n=1 Tax=Rhizobacter sp. LjRoot28 TaxID=3342309 RepID=UPI003ECFBF45